MFKITPILLIFLSVITYKLYSQSKWQEYDYKKHNFKIQFPAKPEYSEDKSEDGNDPMLTFTWESEIEDTLHPNSYYSVTVEKYSAKKVNSKMPFKQLEEFLDATQDDLKDDSLNILISEEFVEKDGYPGKIFLWKNTLTNICTESKLFLVNNVLYNLFVASRKGEENNDYIEKFFDSFILENTPAGTFKIPDGGCTFKINFPGKYKTETTVEENEAGKLPIIIKTLDSGTKTKNLFYIAEEKKYPIGSINMDDTTAIDMIYKDGIQSAISSSNGELKSVADITYGDIPGKEFKIYIKEQEVLGVYHLFFVNNNMYILGVMSLPENDDNEDMQNFFESFEVKN